ncbi:type II toxin-antitoxin system HipA family toxin [Bifidobacterium sp. 82T10]|uniref:Type II toxin-antitoxin system HipA family toxin n=1 Tax=Bifidobacterium miconis TaxID=2834435 RepID=A0ABS6WC78_9BIFI|nr:type II toxin-antitoxin system HipA family toxin [Bifidobacterium miconis]MBW3091651.1 type II toxin-antitoxin system HipA family toxin [Bifidobacterium miconis]
MNKIKTLDVLLEGHRIGVLQENSAGKHTFTYDMSAPITAQLSLSMPRRTTPWEGTPIEAYIDGILPDDPAIRQQIARTYGANARNPFSLLTAVGLDCGGGVQFVVPGQYDEIRSEERVVPISEEQIGARLLSIAGSGQSTWQSSGEHWSLNGAQEKIALRFTDGQWYEAEGAAATTHIIKPGIRDLKEQAFNEYLCMKTAERLSLPVAESEYRMFNHVPAIVSTRWDRHIDSRSVPSTVNRIHQEDLCQAMSVMTAQKYQADGGPGAVSIVRFLRDNGFPEEDVRLFFKALAFNYLIAGSDAHAKNYAILEPAGQLPRLAPLYDLASMFAYDTSRKDRKLAMSIGGEYSWERIDLRHWHRFAEACAGPDDWDMLANILIDLAVRTLPAFIQSSFEALNMLSQLAEDNQDTEDKLELIRRIREGISEQSAKVLQWFSKDAQK